MIHPPDFASALKEEQPGLWTSLEHRTGYSPEGGHRTCLGFEDASFWFRHRNRCIVEMVKSFPPGGPVFEIGAGNGFVTRGLREAGIESVAVEPEPDGARNALDRGLTPVLRTSIDDAGFFPGRLAGAGLFDVLEHIEDDSAFLRRLRGLLRPGGRLYLTVPAHRFLWSHEDVLAKHYRRYSRAELTAVLERSGFEVEFRSFFFAPLPLPILLFRTLPGLLGKSRIDEGGQHRAGLLATRALAWFEERELRRIRERKELRFGASLIACARRKES